MGANTITFSEYRFRQTKSKLSYELFELFVTEAQELGCTAYDTDFDPVLYGPIL